MGPVVTFRGLTIAEGGPVELDSIEGLDTLAADSDTVPLPHNHGGVGVGGWARPQDVILELRLVDTVVGRRLVREAFSPAWDATKATDEPLFVSWPGEPDTVVFVRPARRDHVRARGTDHAEPGLRVVLTRNDPVIYSAAEHFLMLEPYTGADMADYPADPHPGDLTFGSYPKLYGSGGTGGGGTVTNEGSWPVWPSFSISGPSSGTVTVESLENVTTGEQVRFTDDGGLSVPAGSTVIVDMHPSRRVVRFTSGADRLNTVTDLDSWFQLVPGANELRFRAGGSTEGASATVSFRDGWL